MPRAAVGRIDFFGAHGELRHRVGAAAGEPVRIGKDDQRLGVVRRNSGDVLVERDHHFGHVSKGLGGGFGVGGGKAAREGFEVIEQLPDVAGTAISVDASFQFVLDGHARKTMVV